LVFRASFADHVFSNLECDVCPADYPWTPPLWARQMLRRFQFDRSRGAGTRSTHRLSINKSISITYPRGGPRPHSRARGPPVTTLHGLLCSVPLVAGHHGVAFRRGGQPRWSSSPFPESSLPGCGVAPHSRGENLVRFCLGATHGKFGYCYVSDVRRRAPLLVQIETQHANSDP